jgi:dipeptidase D
VKHQPARVLAWLQAFAKERSLEWKCDDTGNMVILRPGSAGGELAPTVVIQGDQRS